MLLSTLALAAFLQPGLAPASTSASPALIRAADTHGKLPWFSGTFEELSAKAKAENKLVFIDFWTTWCGWCKKLDKDTYSNDAVVAEMKDMLVFNIDAESEAGAPLAKRYGVTGFPTLVLLNADASVRDVISGYRPPEAFNAEIQRIRRDEGTVNSLRRGVESNKASVDKRWTLAQKLREIGDSKGFDDQIAEIKKLDPKGESTAMRLLAFEEVMKKVDALWREEKGAESPKLVEEFLATEKNPEILFKGFDVLGQIHGGLMQQAQDDAARQQHHTAMIASWKKAWPHAPTADTLRFGYQVAATVLEKPESISAADKAFALEIAKKLEPLAAEEARVLDVVARAYFVNGEKAKALELAKRCVALDPANPEFGKRVVEFGG